MWRKGNSGILVGIWIVAATVKTGWWFLKNIKPSDPAIPLLVIYPTYLKSGSQRVSHTPMFIAALFTIVKIWQ